MPCWAHQERSTIHKHAHVHTLKHGRLHSNPLSGYGRLRSLIVVAGEMWQVLSAGNE